MKNTVADTTHRQLKEVQSHLADVVKHAYMVIYVEGVLRAEKEDRSFMDVIQSELAERGMLATANGILEFERFRRGLHVPTEAVYYPDDEARP